MCVTFQYFGFAIGCTVFKRNIGNDLYKYICLFSDPVDRQLLYCIIVLCMKRKIKSLKHPDHLEVEISCVTL